MDPMPSGAGLLSHRWTQMSASGRCDCRGGPMWPPACGIGATTTWGRPYRGNMIRAMNPMPSGKRRAGEEGADAAELGPGGAAQGRDLGRAGAMLPAGAATAGEAGGGARSRAEAAVEATAAVAHGWLAAGAAAAGM